jgi:hypothetical protein
VALFPLLTPAATGAFSVITLVLNVAWNGSRFKWIPILAAAYFLLLSGSRTSLTAAVLVFVFWSLSTPLRLKRPWQHSALLVALSLAFILAMIDADTYFTLQSEGETVNSYLFRFRSKPDSLLVEDSGNRTLMWKGLLEAYAAHPILGIGSAPDASEDLTSRFHDEALLLTMLARDGISAIFLIYFFWAPAAAAAKGRNRFVCATSLMWFVFLMSYGSIFSPYNFLYLMFVGLLTPRTLTAPKPSLSARGGPWRSVPRPAVCGV